MIQQTMTSQYFRYWCCLLQGLLSCAISRHWASVVFLHSWRSVARWNWPCPPNSFPPMIGNNSLVVVLHCIEFHRNTIKAKIFFSPRLKFAQSHILWKNMQPLHSPVSTLQTSSPFFHPVHKFTTPPFSSPHKISNQLQVSGVVLHQNNSIDYTITQE